MLFCCQQIYKVNFTKTNHLSDLSLCQYMTMLWNFLKSDLRSTLKNHEPLSCPYFCPEMSAFSSAAYIQVHFRLNFIMEANTMNPDQTAPSGAV